MGTALIPTIPSRVERSIKTSDGQGGWVTTYSAPTLIYCNIEKSAVYNVDRLLSPGQVVHLVYRDIDAIKPTDKIQLHLGRTVLNVEVSSVHLSITTLLVEAKVQ